MNEMKRLPILKVDSLNYAAWPMTVTFLNKKYNVALTFTF
jgi:hypothetical protein